MVSIERIFMENKFSSKIEELNLFFTNVSIQDFWQCSELFNNLDQFFLNNWISEKLSALVSEADISDLHERGVLALHRSEKYVLTVTNLTNASNYFYFHPQHYFARNVGASNINIEVYDVVGVEKNDIFNSNAYLVLKQSLEVRPGEVFRRNGNTEVVDIKSDKVGMLLRLHSAQLGDYEWAFDKESKKPIGFTSVDPIASHIHSALRMLSTLGVSEKLEVLDAALNHHQFHIRWEALKTINKLFPESALAAFQKLSADQHPTIQSAVNKTLSLNAI
jgi:hypothetical protein